MDDMNGWVLGILIAVVAVVIIAFGFLFHIGWDLLDPVLRLLTTRTK